MGEAAAGAAAPERDALLATKLNVPGLLLAASGQEAAAVPLAAWPGCSARLARGTSPPAPGGAASRRCRAWPVR